MNLILPESQENKKSEFIIPYVCQIAKKKIPLLLKIKA
jgi:hypothetical protein